MFAYGGGNFARGTENIFFWESRVHGVVARGGFFGQYLYLYCLQFLEIFFFGQIQFLYHVKIKKWYVQDSKRCEKYFLPLSCDVFSHEMNSMCQVSCLSYICSFFSRDRRLPLHTVSPNLAPDSPINPPTFDFPSVQSNKIS